MIDEAARYQAADRDSDPGHETEDWLEAKRETDKTLKSVPQPQR
jgi:hypothetical protein